MTLSRSGGFDESFYTRLNVLFENYQDAFQTLEKAIGRAVVNNHARLSSFGQKLTSQEKLNLEVANSVLSNNAYCGEELLFWQESYKHALKESNENPELVSQVVERIKEIQTALLSANQDGESL